MQCALQNDMWYNKLGQQGLPFAHDDRDDCFLIQSASTYYHMGGAGSPSELLILIN